MSDPNVDIVEWVAYHLPRAMEWAEAEARSVRAARVANLDRAVATSTCAVGHALDWEWWATQPFYDFGLRSSCGYCGNAYKHQRNPETVDR
jgi:hypothetical protein